ncbi:MULTISPECIES: YciI family protein [unclassified Phenylobacterium]|uniref:YciI family protein n=1 Tax=unclassified Phenylobacterium TaxID=2640670 RepID=UPI00083A6430|nr:MULTISPECIES: YciI family protein [unclassified Phenylobacterium]
MLYAILAYHEEGVIQALTEAEDDALMADLHRVHGKLTAEGRLGPSARLGATELAATVSGPGRGFVTDGPFAETKEHLLGFYVIQAETREAAIEAARDLKAANPSASYEIRPIVLYLPNVPLAAADAGLSLVRP